MPSHYARTPAALIGLALAMVPAAAQSWIFTKIADSNTPVPGDPGGVFAPVNWTPFLAPALSASGHVVVSARYSIGTGYPSAIFTNATGPFTVVANRFTTIPGTSARFVEFDTGPSAGGLAPMFAGWNGALGGIYAGAAPPFNIIADHTMPAPGTMGNFINPLLPSTDGNNTTFLAWQTSQLNNLDLYRRTPAGLGLIANDATPAPGGGFLTYQGEPELSGNLVVFSAESPTFAGIVSRDLQATQPLSVIAAAGDPIPGAAGTFTAFLQYSHHDGDVAFTAQGSGGLLGLYARINGQLIRIADNTTLVPGGGGSTFFNFPTVSIHGDSVAFVGGSLGPITGAVWLWRNGQLSMVIPRGQMLNGLSAQAIFIGPESLKGNTIAFSFTETYLGPFPLKGGLYTATLSCYANCDGSTANPVLNVNDFICFLNRYATGDTYANCDGSTVAPVLNVNDFVCFLNRHAAGCP